MRSRIGLLVVGVSLVSQVLVSNVGAQTTIETDGDVEAQGFIGDGSQVTNVDAETLDSMDSSAFALDADLQSAEAMLVALQAQVDDLLGCRGLRYYDKNDGTVLDCNTGLLWLKDASCAELGPNGDGTANWDQAEAAVAALANETCDLADGSSAGDWRQPTISELCSAWSGAPLLCPESAAPSSLIDSSLAAAPYVVNALGNENWSEGNAFVGVQSDAYWSATDSDPNAWIVSTGNFIVGPLLKTEDFAYVWPVRDP